MGDRIFSEQNLASVGVASRQSESQVWSNCTVFDVTITEPYVNYRDGIIDQLARVDLQVLGKVSVSRMRRAVAEAKSQKRDDTDNQREQHNACDDAFDDVGL